MPVFKSGDPLTQAHTSVRGNNSAISTLGGRPEESKARFSGGRIKIDSRRKMLSPVFPWFGDDIFHLEISIKGAITG
jgi:hypothetical protein